MLLYQSNAAPPKRSQLLSDLSNCWAFPFSQKQETDRNEQSVMRLMRTFDSLEQNLTKDLRIHVHT